MLLLFTRGYKKPCDAIGVNVLYFGPKVDVKKLLHEKNHVPRCLDCV
jgi:hypothetical protein